MVKVEEFLLPFYTNCIVQQGGHCMKRKVLSLLLTLALCLSLAPLVAVPVFAATTDISYALEDTGRDGWNGNAIKIMDTTENSEVANLTIQTGSSSTGTITLTVGHEYDFIWVSGNYPNKCIYCLKYGETVILEGTGSSNSDGMKLLEGYRPGEAITPVVRYDLYIGGTQVTSKNADNLSVISGAAGSASYDATTNTLVLNGYSYSGATTAVDSIKAGIYSKMDLTIDLQGSNTIQETSTGGANSYGIYCDHKLTFKGSGNLDASGTTAGNTTGYSNCGIFASELAFGSDFTGTINATGGSSSASNAMASMGIYVTNLTVNSGTINATGGSCSDSYASSTGIFFGSPAVLTLNGGTVNASGGTGGSSGKSVGIYMYGQYGGATGTLTVGADAALTAAGLNALESYGIVFENDSGGELTISPGGTVTAYSTNATTGNSMGDAISCGIRVNDNPLSATGHLLAYSAGTSTRVSDVLRAVYGGTGAFSFNEGKAYTDSAGNEGETALDSSTHILTNTLASYKRIETTSASVPAEVYDLYIAGTQVTSANAADVFGDGKVSFEANTATLTLNGYSFSGEGYGESFAYQELFTDSPRTNARGAIFSKLDNLTIFLSGTNSVTEAGGDYVSAGIFATGDVTIEGSGSLTATGGDSGAQGSNANNTPYVPYLCGIFAKKLVLNSGTVNCTSGASTRSMNGITTNGLYVFDEFVANGGTLFAIGGSSNSWSYGGQCGTTTINDGDVTISGGAGYNSYGLFGGVLNVYGGELTLRVVSATNQQRALGNQTRTFGPGVSVVVSPNMDGSEVVPFSSMSEPANNAKYLKTSYVPPCTVTITPGANMTKTEDSGAASQTGLTGAMTDVVYTADENYYFPTDYAVASVNGISVTRNDYTKITVSGTPTADAAITLTAPTAKTKLPTPNASFAVTGDSELEISGLVDGTTYSVGFPDGGAADFTVSGSKLTLSGIVAGNYSIKALATGSAANEHIDSDAVQATITKAASPTGVDKTDCTTVANNDGAITGVDGTMEYQKSGDSAWTAVTGTSVTGLVPGTYSVRIAAAGMALASDAVSVTIAEYTAPKADTPVFTPGSQSFTDSIDVTITCALNGAIVYYTDDGSTPSATNGTVTTGAAITLDATKTLKAIAVMTGYDDSEVATATYTKTAPSSGGGGGTTPEKYEVKPATAENGTITVSPENAAEGDKVTITVTPDEGYELDTLTVKDKDGNEIKAKDNGDGTFTIEMPASEIEVKATFKEAEETPGTDDDFPFVDVPEDAYYRKPVEWAVENGITSGVSEDKYGPEMSCTRAQVVTFLWITCGSPDAGTATGFDDVDVEAYYDQAVAWAVEQGITAGTSEGEFSPDMTITRAQFVTMLWVANGKPEVDGEMPFKDVPGDSYYAKAVAWAYANDITAGKSADSFCPEDPCTRGQIMTLLYNAYGE